MSTDGVHTKTLKKLFIDRLVAIIEPTLVGVLSVVIGAVLLSVMLPMAGVISSIL